MMQRKSPLREQTFSELVQWHILLPLVKYSNGGCSGFEPDSLFIYSVYNFSNRIFLIAL